MATSKEDIKEVLGRSPDLSDTLIMRMYFVLREKMLPGQSEDAKRIADEITSQFNKAEALQERNSTM